MQPSWNLACPVWEEIIRNDIYWPAILRRNLWEMCAPPNCKIGYSIYKFVYPFQFKNAGLINFIDGLYWWQSYILFDICSSNECKINCSHYVWGGHNYNIRICETQTPFQWHKVYCYKSFISCLCCVDRISRYIHVKKTNLMHYLSSVFFINRPVHVSGVFIDHHQ